LHLSFHSFIYVFDKWLISLTLNKEKRMKIKLPKEGLTTSEIVQAYGQEKESDVLQTVLEMIQRKEAHPAWQCSFTRVTQARPPESGNPAGAHYSSAAGRYGFQDSSQWERDQIHRGCS
jgi:hypothetical protein